MAVCIASNLAKDIAGAPLLRGVSFKLERRERMTVAGRNGAGKTTLLRMLAGEESIDGGELALAKGMRVALHDQRPPRDRGGPLRDYLLSGCATELAIEARARRARARDGRGATDQATLDRYARAQAELEHHGGYLWRDRATTMARGLGFADEDLDRGLDSFSGGELTRASLARALATGADLLLLDEPTNHLDIESLEWLEQTLVALDAAVVLVAHDRWFLETVGTAVLELEAGPLAASSPAPGTPGAPSRRRASSRSAGRSSASRPRSPGSSASWSASAAGHAGAPGPVARQGAREDRADRARARAAGRARVRVPTPRALAAASSSSSRTAGTRSGEPAAVTLLEDGRDVARARRARLARGAQRGGQDDADRDDRRAAGARRRARLRTGHNVQIGYLSQHADELGAAAAPCSRRRSARPG